MTLTPPARGSQSSLRGANQSHVLEVLRSGPATQAELARATSLSGATVSTIVRDLLAAGHVETTDTAGRGQQLRLSLASGVTAGIAFGNRRALVALGDLTWTVLDVREVPLPPTLDAVEACALTLQALDAALTTRGLDRDALVNVGVGLPAPVRSGGVVDATSDHGRWTQAGLRQALGSGLSCALLVDNDANLAARAEYRWGALRDRHVGAWVKASTGIGVGIVVGGRVHRGAKGMAGELGHLSLDAAGPLCNCGNRGCLELYAALPALTAEYAVTTDRDVTGSELVHLARAGDVVARRLIDDAGTRVGTALAVLVTLLDPELVVIGGDLAEAGDLLVDPVAAALRHRAMPAVAHDVAVLVSELGDQAEVLGALALALESARPRVLTAAAGR